MRIRRQKLHHDDLGAMTPFLDDEALLIHLQKWLSYMSFQEMDGRRVLSQIHPRHDQHLCFGGVR